MENSDFVEVGFAPSHDNLAYASNEVKEVTNKDVEESNENIESEFKRDRPFNSSVMSRKSTNSKVSFSSTMLTSDYAINKLCSYKDGSFAKAVEICKKEVLNDEEYKGSWLLTEISHWNFEFERLVMLTSESVYLIKFDFVKFLPKLMKRLVVKDIVKLQVADLTYPSTSFMAPHDQGGVRIHLGRLSFFQRWNPMDENLPIVTITHHPAIYHKQEVDTVTYNADDFAESLIAETERVLRKEGKKLVMDESPILIESYAGVVSVVHNQSKLGFNLDRGGFDY